MRPFAVLAVIAVLASPAAADRGPAAAPAQPAVPSRLSPIDLSTVPEACQSLAKQAVAPSPAALSARISLAICMADRAVSPLSLCDCGESILAVDTATEPAIALLDEVIDADDPASQAIAEHAEGELYAGFTARLLATLPAPRPGARAAEATLREMRRQTLDAQLAPWREAATGSFQRVVELAKDHPGLADDPAVTTAVRDSQQRLAREPAAP